MPLSSDEMRDIYNRTVVVRRPTYGIVKGYHELPYICLGNPIESDAGSVQVRGKVHVSPRFVIRPRHYEHSYGEVFGEDNMDLGLSGRMFGFLGFRNKPVDCTSEHLDVRHMDATVDELLSRNLDELERREDITTGVIVTPESRYFQVSVERFIASILDDEFSM